MNTINPIITQQTERINMGGALRKAATSPELPNLTQDESLYIKEEFTPSKAMHSYSGDGKVNAYHFMKGANLDTRI
ncbi:MAG: hypothetical protein MI700_05485 [Balneolales bacterium]|nr:hypothetical protein [Balneolales bacterium]